MSIKGLLVIVNGYCDNSLDGIYHMFLPTTDKQKALEYVKGTGDIIGVLDYVLDMKTLSSSEHKNIVSRLIYFSDLSLWRLLHIFIMFHVKHFNAYSLARKIILAIE